MEITHKTPRNSVTQLEVPHADRRHWGQLASWGLLFALMILIGTKLYQVTLGPVSDGRAPDFILTTFDGERHTLSDYTGQIIVINFWASWCAPCALEAADLEKAWRNYRKRDVMFLGIDYVDTESEALTYLQNWGITYPNGPDIRTEISQAYRIKGVPETYIVDQDGNVAKTIIGPINYTKLSDVLDQLLSN